MANAILVVDDDNDILTAARLLLKRHFDTVITTNRPEQIPDLTTGMSFDAVLLDMNFAIGAQSGREGLTWMTRILDADRDAAVVLMTAYSAVETAVEAMKLGAFDFIAKPWQNDKLLATVRAAVQLRQSRRRAKRSTREIAVGGSSILGDSPAIRRVFDLIGKAAPTDANVLVLGENGTGKELVAREIHARSARRDGAFMAVDLGAVAETVLDSELFGHKKGAFTGADADRIGRFQAASGGTLFLDEIGNLPLHLQPKLLTALERREVVPVGANTPVPIDVRVITATNTPRAELADDTMFRQDLLYRLNTVELELPPLRERRDDIPLLARHYLQLYALKYARPVTAIADDALAALAAYSWPGNIRSLRHALERAIILCEGPTLQLADFPLATAAEAPKPTSDEPRSLAALEKNAIVQALARHGGNVTYAAQDLGITRTSLYRRMEKHGL